jgi:hypothetical protein
MVCSFSVNDAEDGEVQASVGGKERGNHQLGVLPRGIVFLLVAMPGAFVFDADVELHLFSPVCRSWFVMKKGVPVEVSRVIDLDGHALFHGHGFSMC